MKKNVLKSFTKAMAKGLGGRVVACMKPKKRKLKELIEDIYSNKRDVYLDLNTGDLVLYCDLVAFPYSYSFLFQTGKRRITVYTNLDDLLYVGKL